MNREEILSLAGAELSNAVARHVMGWKPVVLGNSYEDVGAVWDAGGKWKLVPRVPFRKKDGGLFAIVMEVWEPSRDMNAAWDALRCVSDDQFHAAIRFIRGDLVQWEASGHVASFICRAALLAKFAT